jgi:hypothetical protein
MEKHCASCWSICSDDRAGSGDADLDRRRSDGHAARIYGAGRDGANGAPGESVFGASVRISREAWGSDQAAALRNKRGEKYSTTLLMSARLALIMCSATEQSGAR